MPITKVQLHRDMPDASRVVARLELRESGDPEDPRALVNGLSPAFSLTGDVFESRGTRTGAARHRRYETLLTSGANYGPASEPEIGGAIGDRIVKALPGLAFFESMHLANPTTGEPMHAEANGWYWYAGTRADLRAIERYTGFDGIYAWRLAEEGLTDDDAGRQEYCYRVACRTLRVDEIPSSFNRAAFARFVDDLRELWRCEARDARDFVLLVSYLVKDNPSDPSGQWSVWDLARVTDIPALDVRRLLRQLCPDGGRYVGGTSGYLFNL